MKKYLAVFKHAFITALQYRSEFAVWIILDTLPTIIFFFIWQTVFAHTQEVKGYTLSKMVEFYFYFLAINNTISAHFEPHYVQQIREGKIDGFLIKPISYRLHIFWNDLGNKSFYFVFLLPALFIIKIFAEKFTGVTFSSISPWQAMSFAFLLVIGYCIEFLLSLIIVILGFWFEGAEGLQHFKWILVTLFSGSMMPLIFLPKLLRTAVELSPLKYMYAVPIAVIQGDVTLQLWDIMYAVGFVLALWATTQLLWKKAMYRYSSAGG